MINGQLVSGLGTSLAAVAGLLLACGCQTPVARTHPFFQEAGVPSAPLSANGFYPRGAKMPYMGYSGVPARDLTNGFTVAGPVYGDDRGYVRMCASNGWPVVAHISHGPRFTDKDPAKNYTIDEPALRSNVAAEVRALAPLDEIVWWAITPEELRPWRGNEMKYLEIVSETIRTNDPLQRPIYIYNPNNRDANSLAVIAKHVDVIGKGCYVNSVGKKRDRAWVGWSIEQEEAAIQKAGRPGAFSIVMPELCQDPPPGEEQEIRAWVRHDVYLGLAKGAKGLCLWSLFKRREVAKTWQRWYDAYAECGRELNGERGLAQVFLFGGEPAARLSLQLAAGTGTVAVTLGGDAEPATSSEQEKKLREQKMASWTAREFVHRGDHWLFVVNSANDAATFDLNGWPAGTRIENAFDGAAITDPHTLALPAYGVAALRFTRPAPETSR